MNDETAILKYIRTEGRFLKRKEIARGINSSPDKYKTFRALIKKMVESGTLIKVKGGKYGLPEKMNTVTGVLECHPDGYGFVIPDKEHGRIGEKNRDIYVSPRNIKEAMHGDKVICSVDSHSHGKKGKQEGIIIRILERKNKTIIGVYESNANFGFVIPHERRITKDIYIPRADSQKAKSGQMVVAEISKYPSQGRGPEGKIVEILGVPDDPNVEIEMVIREHGISKIFPEKVLKEAGKVSTKILPQEISGRKDLRGMLTITIDGERAKDFDDAISIELMEGKKERCFRLYVHIADVSHYVTHESFLDKEASQRGTSVYFLDRVIPMLPEQISNEICSLKPNEDRLAVTVEMDLDSNGSLLRYDIFNSIINSDSRMTYTDVTALLENPTKTLKKRYDHLMDKISLMRELCLILNKKRKELGSIDFDLPEPDIVLNEDGRIENILKSERNIAQRIIEEFMLLANVVTATHILNSKYPGIFRVHEEPDPDVISDFAEFVSNFGYYLDIKKKVTAKSLQALLDLVKGKGEEKLLNTIMLRSMKQAIYSENNLGHFALAFDCYTHFTSPIRRYPDLTVHRIIKDLIKKRKLSDEYRKKLEESLPGIAENCSIRERIAMSAEREIIDLNKVHFMENKIGEEYKAFITGVTSFGVFVELENMFVEGLVHIAAMGDDYYVYHEKKHSLIGERTKKVFRVGDEVRVVLDNVSTQKRQIDFVFPVDKRVTIKRDLNKKIF